MESRAATQKTTTIKKLMPVFRRNIPVTQKIFFTQQLQIMIRAGVPLTGALKTLQLQTNNKRFREVLTSAEQSIEHGQTLAEALRPYTKDLGAPMINMIAAGETSGRLEEVLGQVYVQMKKDHEIVSKVRGALVYPAVVVSAMVVIAIGMMIFVIPKLTEIFQQSNVTLPLPTKILIAVSSFMATYALLLIPALIGLVVLFSWAIKRDPGLHIWHGLLLKLPVAGGIIQEVNIARFARTMSSFLKSDIPIVETLNTTATVLNNVLYHDALTETSKRITKGVTLNEALKSWPKLFNGTILQIIAVGEQSGSLDDVLLEAATFYEDEISQIMTTLPALLEPLLMIMLGIGVGFLAISIIMPLYQLTQAF